MNELRKYKRVAVRIPVYISLDGGVYSKVVQLTCLDVSGGGLSFETGREVPLEADSRLVVGKLGDLPASAHIEGRVTHRAKDGKTGRYRIGVEFTSFANVTREELLERIEAWKAQAPLEPLD